jgi:hypothetical protein
MFIPDPDLVFLPIPDQGVKNAPPQHRLDLPGIAGYFGRASSCYGISLASNLSKVKGQDQAINVLWLISSI